LTKKDALSDLLTRYQQKPVLRGLVQLIPYGIGSAVEATLLTRLERINADRLRAFFDELGRGTEQLSPELVRNDDFLHCYFRTVQAVLRSRREQKIRYLARLLGSAAGTSGPESVDEYEELLGIVDDLSFRELVILSTLAKYERETPQGEENDLQRSNRLWDRFKAEAVERTGMSPELLDAWLTRLPRSGCYQLLTGGYASGPLGGQGKLTSLYYRLESLAGPISDQK
jgi:hypothetical protein